LRIHLRRTGGFSGLVLNATVDTESLPPVDARDLHTMVEAAKFFDLPSKVGTSALGADRFSYVLTIEAEGRSHTVEMGEGAVPEGLSPLVRRLMVLARTARRPS